jgi:tetratricopeptide (TPR) repeat protein
MKAAKLQNKNENKHWWNSPPDKTFFAVALGLLILIPTLIYYQSLDNELTNWDDNSYISSNPDIKTLHGDSVTYTLKKTFSNYVLGNYHPLTMLTFCVEYNLFKLNPKPYHITNLLLHILNTLLVFYFILLLCKQHMVAFITALLFAIHPMHVESVSWVAERKDVLYTFFYLLALCCYVLYLQKQKNIFYVATLLLFLLSALSKGMAVSLPLVLFFIDYLLNRKITRHNLSLKIPFLLIALIFGGIAIYVQKFHSALDIADYNFFERILFSCYGLITYLWKLVLPIHLSCYYNYPDTTNGLPTLFYIMPILVIGIAFFIYKYHKLLAQEVIFGLGFFLCTIVMVLQILPVGSSIISERYTYIPYIGLFFIIAWGINQAFTFSSSLSNYKNILLIVLSAFILWWSYLAFQRTKVWHDTIALWTDAIKKLKNDPLAFNNRAETYFWNGDYDRALFDFNRAIELGIDNSSVYYKRGYTLYKKQMYPEAITDLSKAIGMSKAAPIVYFLRAYSYTQTNQLEEALSDYNYVIRIQPNNAEAYHDRGLLFYRAGNYSKAIADFDKAISLNNNYPSAYLSRGSACFTSGNITEALTNFTQAIQCNTNYGDAYYNRAIAHLSIKQFNMALQDALKAKELGINIPDALFLDIDKGLKQTK